MNILWSDWKVGILHIRECEICQEKFEDLIRFAKLHSNCVRIDYK